MNRMRAIPAYDAETGRLVAVALTDRAGRRGARIGVLAPRPDLDAAVEPPLGWHWFEDGEALVCCLEPTLEDVLAQVADDFAREDTADYRLVTDDPPAEQLREIATGRMRRDAGDAELLCASLLRRYGAVVLEAGL